jgi:opacity protein-like surface antigen
LESKPYLAYQNFKIDAMSPGFAVSSNSTNVGYAVGGGGEWALWDRWTAKIEYVYSTPTTLA